MVLLFDGRESLAAFTHTFFSHCTDMGFVFTNIHLLCWYLCISVLINKIICALIFLFCMCSIACLYMPLAVPMPVYLYVIQWGC